MPYFFFNIKKQSNGLLVIMGARLFCKQEVGVQFPGGPLNKSNRKQIVQCDARQIANWFVCRADRDSQSLSIMLLLKLTYIAHGWHLEMREEPLFPNRIEAWKYGPVIVDVYTAFRQQGINVKQLAVAPTTPLSLDDESLLEQVWNIYGCLSATRLSDMTHITGGPWDIAIKIGGRYAPIPDDLIKMYYKQIRIKAKTADEKAINNPNSNSRTR